MSRPLLPGGRHGARGGNHGGDATLHVLRATRVQPAALDARHERIGHPVDADRVDVPAEHHRRPWRGGVEHADHVPAAGRGFLKHDVEAGLPHRVGGHFANRALARRAGYERRIDGVDGNEVLKDGDWIHKNCVT